MTDFRLNLPYGIVLRPKLLQEWHISVMIQAKEPHG